MSRSVYIIGSKGIPAKYGGFETFVDNLTSKQKNSNIKYYVACMAENSMKSNINDNCFIYNGAFCFNIRVPKVGPARAVIYDFLALKRAIKLSKDNKDVEPIFYILACRIGPFMGAFKHEVEKIGGKIYVNPDGHEWKRAKWSYPIRKYWKFSENLMIKYGDLLVCDSKNIEEYIRKDYKKYNPKTTYIAYGTDLQKSNLNLNSNVVREWFDQKNVKELGYYLIVGRFVPENNFDVIIKSFMKTNVSRDLVIISNVENNNFYSRLKSETNFHTDSRVKFVGTVYNQELLKYIRENAYSYIHGHEVGGTNPSLLEAMASTKLNLLLDVGFNREVGEDSVIYWDKDNLSEIISNCDTDLTTRIHKLNQQPFEIVSKRFSWTKIVEQYEKIFLQGE